MSLSKVRTLLQVFRSIAPHLNDEEISEIGLVIIKAINRMEEEQKNE